MERAFEVATLKAEIKRLQEGEKAADREIQKLKESRSNWMDEYFKLKAELK